MQTIREPIPTDAAELSEQTKAAAMWITFAATIPLQLLAFWALDRAGVWLADQTALPIPGNLIGLFLLYALLALGVIKLSWLEPAGSFLIRHLAFFFVPITVGLMNTGPLFAAHGIGIIVALAASAGIGVMLAGWLSQRLFRRWHRREEQDDRAISDSDNDRRDYADGRSLRAESGGPASIFVAADHARPV